MGNQSFVGEYRNKIDGKGRLALPKRFRAKIESEAVLTKGIEPCLYVYPMDTWEEKGRQFAAAGLSPTRRRALERRFYSLGCECELDGQGRIVIQLKYRQYAGLNGDAVVVGARDRIEIWSQAHWDEYAVALDGDDLADLPLPF